ncbi:hypothetical protein [Mycolicibacterium thermoresistibile]|jgi:hypothetical protein|uniref:Uncharacterized protein n=2 Tax=Mycolicibacterium thermoresistibile TaxID=1797 RepID=G7CC32_MYCT3|nr:hypothetical protein [Mycolicibacterium thermoresistibile]EHI14460.1 hypothetical protein KEK_02636 [Mycolicibacterium thermoresistibile ATCC 19527]MCV7187478.1 hypothetical protein [Mycolicibacterium thermoresistibile]GAT17091.1 hypothetical protein RMCT_4060 [Mycolicibacterium thermoresistibile]SNW16530.1 Uncharacterised protein [Mycolicibacterium thermoresistibile]
MAVFLRKLLRIGKLPAELRRELEHEGILHLSEYVAVTRRFSGRISGIRSPGTVASYVGSLVLTNERALATLSSLPKLAGRIVDQRWDAPQAGAVTAEITAGGLELRLDVGDVDPAWEGLLSLHYKDDIPPDVLDQLPRRTLAFDVPPEFVVRTVGVPYDP